MEFKYYLRGLGLGIAVTAIIMGITTSKSKAMTNEEIIARAKQLGMIENTVLTEDGSGKDADDGAADAQPQDADVKNTDLQNADVQNADAQNIDALNPDSGKADADGEAGNGSADGDLPVQPKDGEPSGAGTEDGLSGNGSARKAGAQNDAGNEAMPDTASGADNQGAADTARNARVTDTGTDAEAADPDEKSDKGSADNVNTALPSGSMVITVGRGDGSYSVSKKLADVGAVSSAGDFDAFLCQNGYDKKIRAGTYTIPAAASDEQMARIITGAE